MQVILPASIEPAELERLQAKERALSHRLQTEGK
jgi:muconolactone delta-isomerase